MITTEKKQLIRETLKTLAESHAATETLIEETISILSRILELGDNFPIPAADQAHRPTGSSDSDAPAVDRATLSVIWQGRTCFLGNTLLFWFLNRLIQSRNRYVSHVDLLDDVWGGQRQSATIRGVAKRLRDRLVESGMDDLAHSIDGTVSGYYGLMFV
jgi:hypothetical protein